VPEVPGGTASGWAELSAARWDDARAHFRAALAVEETPAALEGLSWAAWWLDDAETVFAARAGAYRLYREQGNAAAAARMATWLAVDQLDFNGAWAVASGWLQRAHRLLDPLEPGPEHGWLAFHEGYLAYAAGETATARELGRSAAQIGRRLGVPDLEMLGLALEGATLVSCAQVDEGMRCLDEATATALEGEATIPISSAWTFCILVSACVAVLDFERASEWCERVGEFAERYGSRFMLAFCRAEYGAVHVWRGRWPDAETMLEAAVEDFTASRPAWVAGPLVGLAELRRRQGRSEDALALLDQAGPSSKALLCRARRFWRSRGGQRSLRSQPWTNEPHRSCRPPRSHVPTSWPTVSTGRPRVRCGRSATTTASRSRPSGSSARSSSRPAASRLVSASSTWPPARETWRSAPPRRAPT
jgi:LuxR family maltose regulon positive regulatory protein